MNDFPLVQEKRSLCLTLRDAVDYCQKDVLGSCGKMIQYGRFFIRKISNVEYEAVSDWGTTYYLNQHGVLIGQVGHQEETAPEFGQTTLQILRIVQSAKTPIEARNNVMATLPNSRKQLAQKLHHMATKDMLEKVPYEPDVAGAPLVFGYRLGWRGIEILRMNDKEPK